MVAPRRQPLWARQLATVPFETAPGHQMPIDLGQRRAHRWVAVVMTRDGPVAGSMGRDLADSAAVIEGGAA
jgi:hypothetical protein